MLGKFSINYVKMIAKQVKLKIPKSWISQNYLFIHLFWVPLLTNSRTHKTARDLHTPKDFTSPIFNWFLASLSRVAWYCYKRNENLQVRTVHVCLRITRASYHESKVILWIPITNIVKFFKFLFCIIELIGN